ncbi:hypothetical protein [Ruegeria atlantica]|uniref:Uncharacterized protein n=1 Tax=Ruegeria atlantica TaxID=81569 RepID=A0A0P1F8E6_9RHOB|nr:hypothetical protein [Ruegeria atlantica]CUH50239.1 hypothetical protein RUA4292_04445 [Ruegeria atlantica]
MPSETQKRLLLEMFENLPGVVFMLLFRATDDMRLAGWIGTVLAASVCVTYVRKTLRPQPILLGINLFMVAITPLIECLILLGYRDTATILTGNIATLVLMSVFLTGVVLTLFRTNGFLNYQTNGTKQRNTHSAVLLFVCTIGVVWSRFAGDNYLVSLGIPLMVLFGVHQLLRAGITDQQARNGAILACAAPQGSVSDASA